MSSGVKILARGIVIRRVASGEGSIRLQIYTDAVGLVWAHAQSGREERSQLRSHVQVGTRGRFSLVRGKDVWRLAGIAETESIHFLLNGNTVAQKTLQRVLLFIRQFVRGEGSDPYFFSVVWKFCDALETLPQQALSDAEHAVVLRMLAALGYVEDSDAIGRFLGTSFEEHQLSEFSTQKEFVVSVINTGIAASGMS